jgi:anthranilate synthase/aminodeoxychorismate synthase-like glutamine amidotransferase
MIFILDNYDSFVFNLAQYVGELGGEPLVKRNDDITIPEITQLKPSHIIISPGPRTPREAGISNPLISFFAGEIPILGVCLGHQCIGQVFEGRVVHAPQPVHGKSSTIQHDGRGIFQGLPNPFPAGRYHSLVVELETASPLIVSARSEDGVIMGLRHPQYAIEGVQFHPESILTPQGKDLLRNFLAYQGGNWPPA